MHLHNHSTCSPGGTVSEHVGEWAAGGGVRAALCRQTHSGLHGGASDRIQAGPQLLAATEPEAPGCCVLRFLRQGFPGVDEEVRQEADAVVSKVPERSVRRGGSRGGGRVGRAAPTAEGPSLEVRVVLITIQTQNHDNGRKGKNRASRPISAALSGWLAKV